MDDSNNTTSENKSKKTDKDVGKESNHSSQEPTKGSLKGALKGSAKKSAKSEPSDSPVLLPHYVATPIAAEQNFSGDLSCASRRDFLYLTTAAVGAVGAAGFLWPFIHSMNPDAGALASASTEVDISKIAPGQSLTVTWHGKPLFIRHRTPEEVSLARQVNLKELVDPQEDTERVKQEQWLVVVGICTHLGCVPMGQKAGESRGDYNGWLCPCHGSHYDTSGRVRKGPAPRNLEVPPYKFTDPNHIIVG